MDVQYLENLDKKKMHMSEKQQQGNALKEGDSIHPPSRVSLLY